jgi:hypothetical protein
MNEVYFKNESRIPPDAEIKMANGEYIRADDLFALLDEAETRKRDLSKIPNYMDKLRWFNEL